MEHLGLLEDRFFVLHKHEEGRGKHVIDPPFVRSVYDIWLELVVLRQISIDFDRIIVRMVGSDPEMYQVIDRASAEAEFRWAVALAIVPVAAAVAYTQILHSPSYWLGVLGGLGLLFGAMLLWDRGSIAKRQARAYIADSLILGRVVAPTLDALQPLFEKERREEEEHPSLPQEP